MIITLIEVESSFENLFEYNKKLTKVYTYIESNKIQRISLDTCINEQSICLITRPT